MRHNIPPGFLGWISYLVETHRSRLVGIARSQGLDREDALDAVQEAFETFISLPQAREIVEVEDDSAKLLTVIVKNEARNGRRKVGRRGKFVLNTWELQPEIVAGSERSPEDLVAAAEAHIAILGCMKKLKEIQQQVITLRLHVGDELDVEYFRRVEALSLNSEGRENFKIVFSPLHGTGGYPVKQILGRFGFCDVITVPEQADPDGDFPTVSSPNPEDQEANQLALKLASEEDADLVMTTDPDTDRLSLVAKEHGKFVSFNGNQIGSLLMEYILSSLVTQRKMPKSPLVIKTIVTTDLQRDIANHYNVACEETLTGFKWIGDRIEGYESGKLTPYREFVFGGEESYGFLAGTFLRDKDAVSGCALAAEMTAYYQYHGLTLSDVLDKLYTLHGVYLESLQTMTLPGQEGARKIDKVMKSLRLSPPEGVGEASVESVKDYQTSRERIFNVLSPQKDSQAISLPKSNVLQIFLDNGSKISVRPSGTEPKMKIYYAVHDTPGARNLAESKALCEDRLQLIHAEFGALIERIIGSS